MLLKVFSVKAGSTSRQWIIWKKKRFPCQMAHNVSVNLSKRFIRSLLVFGQREMQHYMIRKHRQTFACNLECMILLPTCTKILPISVSTIDICAKCLWLNSSTAHHRHSGDGSNECGTPRNYKHDWVNDKHWLRRILREAAVREHSAKINTSRISGSAGMGYTPGSVRSWDGENPIISFYLFIYWQSAEENEEIPVAIAQPTIVYNDIDMELLLAYANTAGGAGMNGEQLPEDRSRGVLAW